MQAIAPYMLGVPFKWDGLARIDSTTTTESKYKYH
jgi:hypothetical protein